MNTIVIDTDSNNNLIIVSGDINALEGNRRASRFLKDHLPYKSQNGKLFFEIKDGLAKSVDRIKLAANYARCEVTLMKETSAELSDYYIEEEKFAMFSNKALHIRNNECDILDFTEFKESLEKNLTNRTLYELQMLSAYHLAFSQNACNFSVPGAGKTSIVYGAYAYLKNLPVDNPKKVDRLLIISPLNAFSPWELEYKECFGRDCSSTRLSGKISVEEKRQYLYSFLPSELTLISYASVPSLKNELIHFLESNKVMVILDEAHKIKKVAGGIISQSIMDLAEHCKSRVVLTGTPAPNGYEDLYNLFGFIWPNKKIIGFNSGQLKDMSKNTNDPRVASLLDSISPYFIRIRKADLNIPKAIEKPLIKVEMGESQRKIYDFIEKRYIDEIYNKTDKELRAEFIKARMIRLMQAATNPALLSEPISSFLEDDSVDQDYLVEDSKILNEILKYSNEEVPAKFIKAKEIIESIIEKGGKVIVWASFIKNIQSFHDYLLFHGIQSRMLYGGTPIAGNDMEEDDELYNETREAIVKEFHKEDSDFKVIIANSFAVSESISLHKACHNAIYLERSFNAAHFLQSKDRIHRYGLKDDVQTTYYYLASSDSIDETINDRLELKEKRLLRIIESMPIPLFDNVSDFGGDEDIKAVLRDYAKRTKTL